MDSNIDAAFAAGGVRVRSRSPLLAYSPNDGYGGGIEATGEHVPLVSKLPGEEPDEGSARSGIIISMCVDSAERTLTEIKILYTATDRERVCV